jgi:sugar lactone lactonase YvrE
MPSGVAVDDAGNVFVADTFNNSILKVTTDGMVTTLAGDSAGSSGSADGTGVAASFNGPQGVAVDEAGNIFVADSWNNTIRQITLAGVVTTLAGTAGASGSTDGAGAAARFNYPQSIVVDGTGNIFVADTGNNAIRKITPSGVVSTIVGGPGSAGNFPGPLPASILSPVGVAIDSSTGKLYVTLPDAVMVAVLPN